MKTGVSLPETSLRANMPAAITRLIGSVSGWLTIACVLAMLVSILLEVIGRSFFGYATIWVTEVSTYLVVVITFVGAGLVASRDGNVRVDLVLNRFSPERQTILKQALNDISVFLSLVILWKTTGLWADSFENGLRSWSLMNTPLWIPQLAMVIGLAGLSLALIFHRPVGDPMIAPIPALLAGCIAIVDGANIKSIDVSPVQMMIVLGTLSLIGTLFARRFSATVATIAVILPVVLMFLLTQDSPLALKSVGLIATLFFLLFTGLPVVFCLLTLGFISIAFWLPPVALNSIGDRAWEAVNTFELAAIPMFVLMGAIIVRNNASTELFAAAQSCLGRVRGSLAHASILTSGLFAAVSGSSLATAATIGRVAGPEMIKVGYKPELTYGVLAAGGTLGILIPPSIAMIIYGPMAGVPVTELFIAGIVPGFLMICAFALVVAIWTAVDKEATPVAQSVPLREKLRSIKGVIPFLILVSFVLGSIYAGVATPTEAGAVGVLGALAISVARKNLTLSTFIAALEEAAFVTSFLLMIAVGAAVMSFSIDFLAMPQALVRLVESLQLSGIGLFIVIVLFYLMLGMFIEPISMMLITLPIILPVVAAVSWDPLWFGIVLVMLVEIGLITPPVGMILYVLSAVAGEKVSLLQISKGTFPFVLAFLMMIFVFFAMPGVVTFLPELMR